MIKTSLSRLCGFSVGHQGSTSSLHINNNDAFEPWVNILFPLSIKTPLVVLSGKCWRKGFKLQLFACMKLMPWKCLQGKQHVKQRPHCADSDGCCVHRSWSRWCLEQELCVEWTGNGEIRMAILQVKGLWRGNFAMVRIRRPGSFSWWEWDGKVSSHH